ncbi:hypothetical protein K469DRAFT_709939 [Zopfia rhizophila CBS 207.26]|uniref:Uncharacterized protein n=1 Tax=Zopfia rhizophila CBS 207.26 TaxID=1314779 RepID=A0A6A6E2C6_9PEZI|nr:hypothetical protein K469DRAFT_709939 [Zopfia rhizophila CBS 207.26]
MNNLLSKLPWPLKAPATTHLSTALTAPSSEASPPPPTMHLTCPTCHASVPLHNTDREILEREAHVCYRCFANFKWEEKEGRRETVLTSFPSLLQESEGTVENRGGSLKEMVGAGFGLLKRRRGTSISSISSRSSALESLVGHLE